MAGIAREDDNGFGCDLRVDGTMRARNGILGADDDDVFRAGDGIVGVDDGSLGVDVGRVAEVIFWSGRVFFAVRDRNAT